MLFILWVSVLETRIYSSSSSFNTHPMQRV
jgi:hypothetical protein